MKLKGLHGWSCSYSSTDMAETVNDDVDTLANKNTLQRDLVAFKR